MTIVSVAETHCVPAAPAAAARRDVHRRDYRSTRRTMLIVASSGSTGVISACQMPGQTSAPRMDEREVTLSYLTDWTSGARGEWVKQAMPRFTQEFPKVKVQVENATGSLQTVLLASAAGGTIQDVFNNENDVFQTLARQGDMKDIAPVLKSLHVNQNDIVNIPSGYSYRGKQYGLPLQLSLATMMINKTLFKQNGVSLPDKNTTYPQWAELLRRVSRPAEGIWGFQTNGTTGGWGQWMPFVWAYGGDRWSSDLKKCQYDQPSAIEGLQFYADLMHRTAVAPPLTPQGTPLPPGVGFQNGNVACAIATSPGTNIEQQVAGKFEWDIMYNPLGPRTSKRTQTTNTNAICVSAAATKRNVFDQAVQLVAWASAGKTAQDLVVETGASTPVYKPVLNGPKFLAGPPVSQKIVVDTIPEWKDPQIFIGWIEFRDAISAALLPALLNQKSVADAAKEMARVGQLVLDKIPR
jgi:ABC-type glycerol-3-phosphate transport system substrate-binding protein